MAGTQAKYHHLIPQTYMSAWANSSGTLKVEYIDNPGIIVERNKDRIGGFNDYHSIRAGMPLCTEKDAALIFASVSGFTVECDGVVLLTPLDLNKHYYEFDKWNIARQDGSPVSKNKIKHEIDQVKIKDIEETWSTKYENGWNATVSKIVIAVRNASSNCISAFEKDYLMRFYTALDWRGFSSNQEFEKAFRLISCSILDTVAIPEDDRILPMLKTAGDEMRHSILLDYYRQYLANTGVIYHDAMANLANTSFRFLIADGPTKFITCDSPAFIHTREDGLLVGLLPITPKILMAKGKCSSDPDKYYVTHITDAAVKKYNKAIRSSAQEFIIIPD